MLKGLSNKKYVLKCKTLNNGKPYTLGSEEDAATLPTHISIDDGPFVATTELSGFKTYTISSILFYLKHKDAALTEYLDMCLTHSQTLLSAIDQKAIKNYLLDIETTERSIELNFERIEYPAEIIAKERVFQDHNAILNADTAFVIPKFTIQKKASVKKQKKGMLLVVQL